MPNHTKPFLARRLLNGDLCGMTATGHKRTSGDLLGLSALPSGTDMMSAVATNLS
jgi:hypothetical protein